MNDQHMTDDYELSESPCPACGHSPTHSRYCSVIDCEDGFIDESHDDPINFAPGEELTECHECYGTGIQKWCPKCGADFWCAKAIKDKRLGHHLESSEE